MLSFRQKTPKQTLLFLFSSSKYKTNSSDKNALFEKRERREEERCRRETQMRVYLKCFCGVLWLFCLPVLRLIEERISILVSDFELTEKRAKSKKRGRVVSRQKGHTFSSLTFYVHSSSSRVPPSRKIAFSCTLVKVALKPLLLLSKNDFKIVALKRSLRRDHPGGERGKRTSRVLCNKRERKERELVV